MVATNVRLQDALQKYFGFDSFKGDQEKILPYLQNRTVKDIKKIVNLVKKEGVDFGISESKKIITPPREYLNLIATMTRANKFLSQILIEELDHEGEEKERLIKIYENAL